MGQGVRVRIQSVTRVQVSSKFGDRLRASHNMGEYTMRSMLCVVLCALLLGDAEAFFFKCTTQP